MLAEAPHHIIAIGASAGGMEEINTFFDHTPLDGVSYVIVQHLSPDVKSRMAELLAKHSKLVIQEAENDMAVKSNEVYLIPNDKFMTIHDSKLYLEDKDKIHGPHLTINTFFKSLAADSGVKAIGVVLSGLGSDGTEGVMAIKDAGGMVIVRNPDTSEFASMPAHAIATGVVDFILEPELMPDAIEDYVKKEIELSADNKDDEKNSTAITDLIKEQLPVDFSEYKQTTILRRIKKRATSKNFKTLENYLEFLKKTPAEVEALAKDFLISVTSFFRDKEAFNFLEKNILPHILKNLTAGEELKMWVAGCATGEEAYSMAVLVCEQLKGINRDTQVKIFATDIDTAALDVARTGLYRQSITKHVSAERLEKYFSKDGDNYRINADLRRMVIFARHDMVKNPPYCNMHFISCRNVLIYMTQPLQKKIFLMLLFGLKKDGYLFLGSSENPMPIIANLEVVNKKWRIYKNIEEKRLIRFDAFSLPDMLDLKRSSSFYSREDAAQNTNILAETVNVSLINELDCLVVCIDENNQVLKSYGDTTKYLLQQNFNLNLAELLPKPLAVAFNTLSTTAFKTYEKATLNGIKIKYGKDFIKVSLSVSPLPVNKGDQKLLMVTFNEDKLPAAAHEQDTVFDDKLYLDQYTMNLEKEIKELKEKLQTTYEKLDASNENMQSFNEELLSANEEMQSTNEEMQSVNEELHTINADYQAKNKELQEVNDDLNNYFRSNINGQLFVDNYLLLMKFSPGAVKQINLRESDIGRPLSHISTNLKFDTIIPDIEKVLVEGSVINKEIETLDGKWYQVVTMPYISQADDKKNGAIITFNDITALKKIQLELDKKNQSLQRINADLDNFVHTASHDLLGPLSSIQLSIDVMNEIKITDPQVDKFLHVINSSMKKFYTLISDISTIAKVENDMQHMEMVDIEEITGNIEWSLEDKINAANAVINKNLEVKEILFSKKNLRSILYNLISNAIKFRSNKAPVINIRTTREQEGLVLSVEDNGIGMDKEAIHTIFQMYGRLNQMVEGHGIGLYLAKKIVDASGGYIMVESEPGKGSKFIIHFKTEPEHLNNVSSQNKFKVS